MKKASFHQETVNSSDYSSRTPSYYLEKIDSHILESFNPEQLQAITSAIEQAIPKPSPKLVDLRFSVDLVFFRFYIVIICGKGQTKKTKKV